MILNQNYTFLENDYGNQNLWCGKESFNNEGVLHEIINLTPKTKLPKWILGAIPAFAITVPGIALASDVGDTFGKIHHSIMNIFDGGVVIVFIFAGAVWGLGHRSKAIELLICASCGYLLARHATDIRDYLKTI